MSKLSETMLVIRRLGSAYNQKADEEKARAYHQVLGEYPRMALAEAATICLGQGNEFFPKPVELLTTIKTRGLDIRWLSPDKFMERAFWLAYVKGLTSSDELTEEDCNQIFADLKDRQIMTSDKPKPFAGSRLEYFKQLYQQQNRGA